MRITKRKKQGQNVKAMQTAIDRRISIGLQMFLNRVAAYNQQQARNHERSMAEIREAAKAIWERSFL